MIHTLALGAFAAIVGQYIPLILNEWGCSPGVNILLTLISLATIIYSAYWLHAGNVATIRMQAIEDYKSKTKVIEYP